MNPPCCAKGSLGTEELFCSNGESGPRDQNRDQCRLGNKDETSSKVSAWRPCLATCSICASRVYDQEQGMPWGDNFSSGRSTRSTAKIVRTFPRFDGHARNKMENPTEEPCSTSRGFSESEDRVMGSSPKRSSGIVKEALLFSSRLSRERIRDVGNLRITLYTEFVACGRGVISSRYHPVIQSPWLEKF